jgi:two-component system, chemotaxis family, protein-glutamate methylesterase/glutaminase
VSHDLVVIGASWGGLTALRLLLGGLPGSLGAAVAVVQHRAADADDTLTEVLAAATELVICDAEDKQRLDPGHVFVAPPGYHLLVEESHFALSVEGPVAYSRPSIDVLFETAADAYRERCVGVILTGANNDGARGLAHVAALGGAALVQDPTMAERSEMPTAALRAVPTASVGSLQQLAAEIVDLCGPVGAAA